MIMAAGCTMLAASLPAMADGDVQLPTTPSGNNVVDEVAWTIGDQPIYKSDVEEAYQQALYERMPIKGDPYCVFPEQLAIEKLFLHQADIDTVEVAESMVSLAVDQRMNYLITNLGSKEKVEEYFRRPLSEVRTTMLDGMRNQYRVQEVQRSLTKDFKSTPAEIQRYFAQLPPDSIPYVPLTVEAEIITIQPRIPQEEIDDVKSRLRQYADRVNKGESDFSTLAILYSEDPGSSVRGGEIGFMGRGHLEPEYAAVAFNLNDTKKVSKIVQTQYGYHIIQLIEKRGDRVNTRHILLRPKGAEQDLTDAVQRLDSVRTQIIDQKLYTFEEVAPIISQDKDTRNNSGRMINQADGTTRFEMKDLPQEVARKIDTMEPGEISEAFIMKDPRRDQDIVAMVKLTNRIPAHKANLSDDYQTIKTMYENSAKQEIVRKWLSKKIKDTYVKIEDNWVNGCEYIHPEWLNR